MGIISNARIQHLIFLGQGVVPTIPTEGLNPGDPGWLLTDIMEGEKCWNKTDNIWYYRKDDVIYKEGSTGSVEKDPFNETIQIDNLVQHSPNYTQSGILNMVKGSGTFVSGTYQVLIDANGDDINFSTDFIVYKNDYDGTPGEYLFVFLYLAEGKIAVSVLSPFEEVTPPTIISVNENGLNDFVEIDFSGGMWGDAGASQPMLATDFETWDFQANGGGATGVSISTVEKSGGSGGLTGGESTVRYNLSFTGTPSGGETFKIRVAGVDLVFNASGVSMEAGETTSDITAVTPEILLLEFQTNSPNGDTFDATFEVSGGGSLKWDMGDGTVLTTNVVSAYEYADGTTKTVRIYQNTLSGPGDVTAIRMFNNHIIGELNLSPFTSLSGNTNLSGNLGLTNVDWPITSGVFTALVVSGCGLNQTQDISTMPGIGGIVQFHDNPNLPGITNPTGSQAISSYYFYNTGVVSMSFTGLSGFAGDIRGYNCPNMTTLAFPSVANLITGLRFYICPLLNNVDISVMTNVSGVIQFFGNTAMTNFTPGSSSQVIDNFNIQDSGLAGNLNVSGYTMGGTFATVRCASLTSITHGASSETFNIYWIDDCDITGTHNVSMLTGWGGDVQVDGNSNMSGLTPPNTTRTFSKFYANDTALGVINFSLMPNMTDINNCVIRLQRNNFVAAETDENLVNIDAISTSGFTGRSVVIGQNITEGTPPANAAPTDGTVTGFDGLTAKSNLETDGFTVTVNNAA